MRVPDVLLSFKSLFVSLLSALSKSNLGPGNLASDAARAAGSSLLTGATTNFGSLLANGMGAMFPQTGVALAGSFGATISNGAATALVAAPATAGVEVAGLAASAGAGTGSLASAGWAAAAGPIAIGVAAALLVGYGLHQAFKDRDYPLDGPM